MFGNQANMKPAAGGQFSRFPVPSPPSNSGLGGPLTDLKRYDFYLIFYIPFVSIKCCNFFFLFRRRCVFPCDSWNIWVIIWAAFETHRGNFLFRFDCINNKNVLRSVKKSKPGAVITKMSGGTCKKKFYTTWSKRTISVLIYLTVSWNDSAQWNLFLCASP